LKGSAILPIVLAGLLPILLLAFLASGIGFGLVAWQPPVLWTDTFGNATSRGDNAIVGVSSDSSGVYSAAYSNYSGLGYPGGSLHLTKYDPNGGLVWTHTVGNFNADIRAISMGAGGIYLVGDNVDLPAGVGYVQRFDSTGNRLWTSNSTGGRVVSATASEVYVAGQSTIQEYDLKGNLLWTSQIFNTTTSNGEIYSVHADGSGAYVAGDFSGNLTGQTPTGGKDVFLVRYGLSGGLIWANQFGTEFDHAYSVSSDSTGVYLSGTTYLGALPGFGWLRKFDFSGNLQWTLRIDSPDGSGAGDSSILADGSGIYVSINSVASREYLMKYDHQGNQAWSFQMGRHGNEIYSVGRSYRLSLASDALYVAGSADQNGNSIGFLSRVSTSPSLVAFGLNPPLSFIIIGGLISGSAIGLVVFRRLRRKKLRPTRVGPSSLPTTD